MTPTPRTPGVEWKTDDVEWSAEVRGVGWPEVIDAVSPDPEAGTKSEGRSEPDLSQAIKERDEAVRLASEMADLLALATTPERFGEAGTGDVYLRMVAAERKFRAFLTTMEKCCG